MKIVINSIEFLGPYVVSENSSIDRAGIYAILAKRVDGTYDIIYIGESGELGTRIGPNHHRWDCWQRHSGYGLQFAYRLYPASGYTKDQRLEIEKRLIDLNNPICNRQ